MSKHIWGGEERGEAAEGKLHQGPAALRALGGKALDVGAGQQPVREPADKHGKVLTGGVKQS